MSRSGRRHFRRDRRLDLASSYDGRILVDGPIMYLPLSGTIYGLNDQTGNGHHGTAFNSPTRDVFLNGDGATAFNGTNQYVQVPDHDDLSIPTTGTLTIEMWIRPDVLNFADTETATAPYIYFAGKNTNSNSEYVCRMYSHDADWAADGINPPRPNRISGYANNLSGGLGAGSYFQDTVTIGEWIHYVLVINTANTSTAYPTGYTKIYKNGVIRAQNALINYNIVPGNGSAPFRIATATLNSFFQGAIAKLAMYNFELSPTTVHDHYRLLVSPHYGTSGFIKHVGDASNATAGTTLSITVPAAGVAAGSTLLVSVTHIYTAGAPTVADSRGNTYTRDRTSATSGNTMRASLFSAPINVALQGGDTILVTLSASVAAKAATVDEFSHITFASALETSNARTGASTTPGTTNLITTTSTDDLIYGITAVEGPTTEVYTEDTLAEFNTLTRAGTTGGSDITMNTAYRTVNAAGGYKYQPTLGTSENWVSVIAAYKAGAPTISPPVTGTAQYIGLVGSATATTSGSTLTITVGDEGVTLGHTLIVRTLGDFVATNPTIVDSRGNTYTLDRGAPNTGNTIRAGIFSAPMTTALQAGDTITVTWPSSVTTRAATIDEFANVAYPTVTDKKNGTTGSSTSPAASISTSGSPTTNADDLLVGFIGVEGPTDDSFTENTINQWTSLTRVGTTGNGTPTNDRTINSAYRIVGATGAYSYAPTLGTSRVWVSMGVAYQAGTVTITPPPTGTAAFVKNLGSASAQASGTTLSITIPAGGVSTGRTVIVRAFGDYTNNNPSIVDSRGNTYTADRSGADAGSTVRAVVYSCPVTIALQPGDTIALTWPASVTTRTAVADEFSGVLSPIVLDGVNGHSGTGISPSVTRATANADDLLIGLVGVAGDSSDTFSEDLTNSWTSLTRIGTTGGTFANNRTLNSAYRAVASAASYTYQPALTTSSLWVALIVAYKAS